MIKHRLLLSLRLLSLLALWLPLQPANPVVAQTTDFPLKNTSSIYLDRQPLSTEYLSCGNINVPVVNMDYEQAVVELVNHERDAMDLPPLKRVEGLDNAARYHSTDLAQDNYFEHDTYDRINNELNFVCSWSARIGTYYSGVRAENIAAGYSTPEDVVQAWMNSAGHRQNILSSYSDEIGVGYYQGSGHYGSYWTMDFGDRNGVYPVVINGEAAETNNRLVSLYIYGKFSEMRLRNDDGMWTAWQTFNNTLEWLLPATNGEHQVSVEMRGGATTYTSSDSIVLHAQTSVPELGNLPSVITFTYFTSTKHYFPEYAMQTPENVGSSDPLDWELSTDNSWFVVSPTVGTTPDAFSIFPSSIITASELAHTGVITVTANSPDGMLCTPHVMNVSIHFINGSISQTFIPLVTR